MQCNTGFFPFESRPTSFHLNSQVKVDLCASMLLMCGPDEAAPVEAGEISDLHAVAKMAYYMSVGANLPTQGDETKTEALRFFKEDGWADRSYTSREFIRALLRWKKNKISPWIGATSFGGTITNSTTNSTTSTATTSTGVVALESAAQALNHEWLEVFANEEWKVPAALLEQESGAAGRGGGGGSSCGSGRERGGTGNNGGTSSSSSNGKKTKQPTYLFEVRPLEKAAIGAGVLLSLSLGITAREIRAAFSATGQIFFIESRGYNFLPRRFLVVLRGTLLSHRRLLL